jgi:hypothetical protein
VDSLVMHDDAASHPQESSTKRERALVSSGISAISVIAAFDQDVDLKALISELTEINRALAEDDTSKIEAMLLNQAHALQAIYSRSVRAKWPQRSAWNKFKSTVI